MKPKSKTMQQGLGAFFSISPEIRYVALYRQGQLISEARPGLKNASSPETDRYEELLVNPTLITLLRQRGEMDCGGFVYALIRYGSFFQLVSPLDDGHLSICIGPEADPLELIEPIRHVYGSIKMG